MESDRGGVFWREGYWFAILTLVAITIALLVLPPKAVEYRSLSRMEAELEAENELLDEQQEKLDAAITAMKDDPFYREGVFRKILGVKKSDEVFLDGGNSAAGN